MPIRRKSARFADEIKNSQNKQNKHVRNQVTDKV